LKVESKSSCIGLSYPKGDRVPTFRLQSYAHLPGSAAHHHGRVQQAAPAQIPKVKGRHSVPLWIWEGYLY
nr:hypothetical protein [Tanacetum cinerariifolium]